MEKIFKVKDLNVHFPCEETFGGNKGFIYAVNGVNLKVRENEILSIVGESGCGKSTLANTLMGLVEKTSGNIIFEGKDTDEFNKDDIKNFRKNCQMVFQNPFSSLNPRMNIFDILKEPLIVNGMKNKQETQKRVSKIIELVGLDKSVLSKFPHEFSGGQRQRIAIARALILNPKVIVADEPVSALDVSIQAQIINLLLELKKKLNLTVIFISHDLSVVKHISDRVAVMYLGEIAEIAAKDELFSNPRHPYTKLLLSSVPRITCNLQDEKSIPEGDLPSVKNPPKGCKFHTRCKYAMPACSILIPQKIKLTKTHKVYCHLFNKP